MALDLTTGSALLKKVYLKQYYDDLIAKSRVSLALLKKDENFTGSSREVRGKFGLPQSVSNDFATAAAAAAGASSKWSALSVTGVSKNAVVSVSGDIIAQASDDVGGYLRPVKEEIDGSIENLSNRRAAEIMGSGWGDIGVIETGSISGSTFRVATQSDMVKFEKGLVLVFAQTQAASALRASGGTLTVTAVDRASRTVTVGAAVSTLSGVTSGDYIFVSGDREDSATPSRKCIAGFQAWIPPYGYSFASDNFFGQDRSLDPTRLAGQRLDASTGISMAETLQNAATVVSAEGGTLDHFIVSPTVYNRIAIELGQRVRQQPIAMGKVGFSSLAVQCPSGDVTIVSDRFQSDNSMLGIELDSWRLLSKGSLVKVSDDDGLMILRDPSNDGIQARIISRNAQLVCTRPFANINVKLA